MELKGFEELSLEESMLVDGGAVADTLMSILGSVFAIASPIVGAVSGAINLITNVLGGGINTLGTGFSQIISATMATYLNAFMPAA
ncbi:MAG: hypothetical protein LBT44_01410 [Clostridiales bacterium]|nr:hypothetical protein [Clostridiales bacterium]